MSMKIMKLYNVDDTDYAAISRLHTDESKSGLAPCCSSACMHKSAEAADGCTSSSPMSTGGSTSTPLAAFRAVAGEHVKRTAAINGVSYH
jgi:hypothetical protein